MALSTTTEQRKTNQTLPGENYSIAKLVVVVSVNMTIDSCTSQLTEVYRISSKNVVFTFDTIIVRSAYKSWQSYRSFILNHSLFELIGSGITDSLLLNVSV